ncbi:hypothetical protein L914_18808 [Phytophthora nicotianae]|uniref:Uncharacterized protein n=1 Tax=Phytophthora nicotianae TaxID=4792 RepID=W2MCE0_PHYNI|nr:hypothetical protein L914_18808 [Phytophthora nicotianae]
MEPMVILAATTRWQWIVHPGILQRTVIRFSRPYKPSTFTHQGAPGSEATTFMGVITL